MAQKEDTASSKKKTKLLAARRINHAINGSRLSGTSASEQVEDISDIDIEERKLWREVIEDEMFKLDKIDPKGTLSRYFKKGQNGLEGYTFQENVERIKRQESHLLISDPVMRNFYKKDPIVLQLDEARFQTKRDKVK